MQKFITQFLISGPIESEWINQENQKEMDQLSYESYLRSKISIQEEKKPWEEIRIDNISPIGKPWKYYYSHGNWFVDESRFYPTLMEVEMLAVTGLWSDYPCKMDIILWSYAAVGVWCNEKYVGGIKNPVYKPITKKKITLDLKEGYNEINLVVRTLGVRDTSTVFGIELMENEKAVEVKLAKEYGDIELFQEVVKWLDQLEVYENMLRSAYEAPKGAKLYYEGPENPDFNACNTKKIYKNISGIAAMTLDVKREKILIEYTHGCSTLSRTFECMEWLNPVYMEKEKGKYKEVLKKIAAVGSLNRDGAFGFPIPNILARKALGQKDSKEISELLETLRLIEERVDCADFLVSGLIRYIKNYEVDPVVSEKMKTVLTGFRYWMDQDGSDAMCFWSENHALMFYSSAMFCGELYPEEYFERASMYGWELRQFGRERVIEWIEDVEIWGFEEFHSSIYVTITFIALLNLIDFGDEEISQRTTQITNRLIILLAKHTFEGVVIAPMGRVYREVLYPFRQGAQGILNLIKPDLPYTYSEGWLSYYATSMYKFPKKLSGYMNENISMTYLSGNACIHLYKRAHYIMTSVEIPREDTKFKRWENISGEGKAFLAVHEYTKSLNESFHGTTDFRAGGYGYQQHLWYAALDKTTPVFVNHPGETADTGSRRPGYWFGNGVFPALYQKDNVIGCIYRIPQTYPIHFTHVYWPSQRFDRIQQSKHWIFGKKGKSYIGLWCSGKLEWYNDKLAYCELRVYESESAYLCICSDSESFADFDGFVQHCMAKSPEYDFNQHTLTASEFALSYPMEKQ